MKLHGVVRVVLYQCSSFFLTRTGWYAGSNGEGQFGLGHRNKVSTPTRIQSRWNLVDIFGNGSLSFFTTTDPAAPLVACGWNYYGCLGVSSLDERVLTFTPVTLPAGLDVTRVMLDSGSTFIFSGTRCLVCGDNRLLYLGLPTNVTVVRVPTELPFTVNTIIMCNRSTVFISEGRLLAIGDQRGTNSLPVSNLLTVPTPFDYPQEVTCIRLTDNDLMTGLLICDSAGWRVGKAGQEDGHVCEVWEGYKIPSDC